MNKYRRKEITELLFELEEVQTTLQNIQGKVDDILEEEQDCYDNIPENLRTTQTAENSEQSISDLEDAQYNFDRAMDCLDDVIVSLSSIWKGE